MVDSCKLFGLPGNIKFLMQMFWDICADVPRATMFDASETMTLALEDGFQSDAIKDGWERKRCDDFGRARKTTNETNVAAKLVQKV